MKPFILLIGILLFLSACNNPSQDMSGESSEEKAASTESADLNQGTSQHDSVRPSDTASSAVTDRSKKMMVYEAHINLETKDYEAFRTNLEEKLQFHAASIVETSIRKTENGNRSGHIRLRVPQKNFEALMTELEEISSEILSRNISSRDVTAEYVDLESRLKAKKKIEARLLSFLEKAEKTEDLIKISQDLERVQSEMEVIQGRIKYLGNQVDYSTITLTIKETKVPSVGDSSLNTWERTKHAFVTSIHFLASTCSWMVVTLIGYSPVIVPVGIIGLLYWWRRRRKSNRQAV